LTTGLQIWWFLKPRIAASAKLAGLTTFRFIVDQQYRSRTRYQYLMETHMLMTGYFYR